jgi:hypothetical protein
MEDCAAAKGFLLKLRVQVAIVVFGQHRDATGKLVG